MRIALSVLLFFSSQIAFAGTVELKTVDDVVVSVNETEVLNAYHTITTNIEINAKETFVNQDGSWTLVEPRFRYKGENYPLSPRNGTGHCFGNCDITNVCALFGFSQGLGYTARTSISTDPQKGGIFKAIQVNPAGKFVAIVRPNVVVAEVTCLKEQLR